MYRKKGRIREAERAENHKTPVSYIPGHILGGGAIIRLFVCQERNDHTGPAKVVFKYGLYIDIWEVGFTNHYIYVRSIGKAC